AAPAQPGRENAQTVVGFDRRMNGFRFDYGSARSAQLAVLAPAAVVAREGCGLPIFCFLAGEAEPDTGDGIAPRLRNLRAAFRAMGEARPRGQPALRAVDPVLDRRIDLILYSPVACPTRRHRPQPQYPLFGDLTQDRRERNPRR